MRLVTILSTCTALVLLSGPAPALEKGGPVVAVGQSSKNPDKDFTTYSVGWRFPLPPPVSFDALGERLGGQLDLFVEPLFGIITGDADTVEFSVVPMVRYRHRLDQDWAAFVEGGLGLAYSDLRGVNLGSRMHFASQASAGLAHPGQSGRRVSVGLRVRHISHAGLWADANSGFNTEYLVISFD
ncbi:uncharacterized protein METZ01_LOCUS413911 [marine metagenome]|uniref:Acyloxyacyl hydrolase n=1 Tax=marine metagenome TaxID=408172 RepID=A0A382WQD8_9ZZZZ